MSSELSIENCHSGSEFELEPQPGSLGGESIDRCSRAGKPSSNDCHGFFSVCSLRFLVQRLDESAFLAKLIEIFRALSESGLRYGFCCVGIHCELPFPFGVHRVKGLGHTNPI